MIDSTKDDITTNLHKESVEYHVVIMYATTFLEESRNRISNIFNWPVRGSGPKSFEPEENGKFSSHK